MSQQTDLRDRFLTTLNHVNTVASKVTDHTIARGHRVFNSPDQYRIFEGLFLSAWTYWEQFIRQLLIADLADSTSSILRKRVTRFRTKKANEKLAELILEHPDSPERWIEWSSVNIVVGRANFYLGAVHRFTILAPLQDDFGKLKRIRNAVAHKSDKAWSDFKRMITNPPFSLTPAQTKGVTVGRFLATETWNGSSVFGNTIVIFETTARNLVP